MKIFTSLLHEGVLLLYRIESDDRVSFNSYLVNRPSDRYYNYFRKIELIRINGTWSSNNHSRVVVKQLIVSIEHYLPS